MVIIVDVLNVINGRSVVLYDDDAILSPFSYNTTVHFKLLIFVVFFIIE